MRRREFVALGAAVLLSNRAIAQDTRQRRSVGVLMGWVRGYPLSEQYLTAFLSSFKQLGWQEGSNVNVEVCWPTEELQMVPCAERLVTGNHDVIIATATPALEALVARTQSIPTVFVLLSEPLGRGFVKDLARPGGNLDRLLQLRRVYDWEVASDPKGGRAASASSRVSVQPGHR